MKRLISPVLAAISTSIVVLGLTACGTQSTAPRLDRGFGVAVDNLRLQQTLNPDAAKTSGRDLPPGIDGETGVVIIQGYRQSFSAPVQQGSGGTSMGLGF
jgi:hypothetical protein